MIFSHRFFAALALAMLLSATAYAEEPVSLNFVNAEVDSVVRAIGKISGRSFIIDPRVKGTINIVSTQPISTAKAYEYLLSALRLQGFAAIETNGVTLVLPEADAKLHYSAAGNGKASGDRIVTEVLMLSHESAAQLVPVLKPMVSANNHIAAYPGNNAIVITDYAENVRRIREIVQAIDLANNPEPVLIPLKHVSVVDLMPQLNRLLQDSGAATSANDPARKFSLIPDLRTNSLYVQAPSELRLSRLRQTIEKLDVPGSNGSNIHVVFLKNADASKLAQTLRAILSGDNASNTPPPSSPGSAATPLATASNAVQSGRTTSTSEASTPGIVQADVATNSLIITAPEPTFNVIRGVIEKLDMRRAQVFVEALVAEISAERATEFGVQWNALGGLSDNSTRVIGGTNFTGSSGTNVLGVAANPASLGRGLNIGIVKGTITIPGISGPIVNLGALARALETDGRTNILSTPNLLTLDSEEAKIVVGQNVPFVTGQYAQTGNTNTASPFQTIERKDVGLMLKVKPQITEGGSVRMSVVQEVSSVSSDSTTLGPTTNKRSVETTVVVDDGDFIVIGGLIQDSLVHTQDRVPLLGDIPYLGALFRYQSEKRVKTNLMVFLRPVVVRSSDNANKIASDRYDYLLMEQQSLRDGTNDFSKQAVPRLLPRDAESGLPPSATAIAKEGAAKR